MKLSSLLAQHQVLLHKAHLANLAFAYDRLNEFADRIARAGLAGAVRLQSAAPESQRYCPTLTALEGSQAVLEEYFIDEDLWDLADVIGCALEETKVDVSFRLEDVRTCFLAPLREQLIRAGITIDRVACHKGSNLSP